MRRPHPHHLRRASVALCTALTLLAPSVRAAEPSAEPVPVSFKENVLLEKARSLYAADEYLPAATTFEALHNTTQNPLYLYYAGLAREGAGHDAHAIRHWQQALRVGLDSEFTAKAKSRLEQAKARTTALTVTVDPPSLTDGASLELRAALGERQPITLPLTELPVHLEPGKWTATLTPNHPAFAPRELTLTITRSAPKAAQEFKLKALEHPTTFEFTPASAPLTGVVLTLHDPDNLTPDRRLPVQANPLTLPLRAGSWHYILEVPGRPSQSGTLVVTAEAADVTLALPMGSSPGRTDAMLPRPTRRKLALGLGLGALAPATGGAVLTGIAGSTDSKFQDSAINEHPLKRVHNQYFGGTALLGAAAGIWTGAMFTALPLKRRGWYTILGVSSVISGGGLALNIGTFLAFRGKHFSDGRAGNLLCDECGSVSPQDWKSDRRHLISSSILIGFGAGLLLSAASNLVAAKRSKNIKVRASANGVILNF